MLANLKKEPCSEGSDGLIKAMGASLRMTWTALPSANVSRYSVTDTPRNNWAPRVILNAPFPILAIISPLIYGAPLIAVRIFGTLIHHIYELPRPASNLIHMLNALYTFHKAPSTWGALPRQAGPAKQSS